MSCSRQHRRAATAHNLSEPLVEVLEPLGRAARPAAIVVVTLGLTFVTLVFGELAPKRIAMQRAEGWGLVAARPLAALAAVTRPAVWLLGRTTDVAVCLVGADPNRQREEVTEEELRDMVAVQPELTDEERAIIDGAFEFADRTLRQILVPRPQVVALPTTSRTTPQWNGWSAQGTRERRCTGRTSSRSSSGDL